MKSRFRLSGRILSVWMALVLACGSALAAKPEVDKRGNGKAGKQRQEQPAAADIKPGSYFGQQQRADVARYYGEQRKAGRCPPGLAKKNNGCRPPGQVRKWALGQPLPSSVVVYPVPQAVVITIGLPPPGYRYVRVANDLLLMAIGTRLVVDAVEDLMGL